MSRRRGEEREQTRGIGAVNVGHVIGVDDVAFRLRHLGAIRDHHALREQLAHRLVVGDQPDVAHHFGPEARIDQMQDGVLHATDVLIDGEPVGDLG